MSSRIKHSFKEGVLALISGNWANRVARFCSYWSGRNGIDVLVQENPSGNSPNFVSLNIPNATKLIVNEMTGNLGIKLDHTAHPLELKAVTKDSSSSSGTQTVDYAAVFLPSTTLYIKGTAYTITGVTAITDGGGWYKITGRTTGNFYLNKSGSNLVWSTSAQTGTGAVSYFVGSINASTLKVTQYARAMGGTQVAQEESESGSDIPEDNITGTLINTWLVKASGTHTVTSSCLAPVDNTQLVIGSTSMTAVASNSPALPMLTQESSSTKSAIVANSGIVLVDMTTKKAIKGDNVKVTTPSGTTLREGDLVSVKSDGTLTLDQTDYAYFDKDNYSIQDGCPVIANGTNGEIYTTEHLDASKISVYSNQSETQTLDQLLTATAEGGMELNIDELSPLSNANYICGTDDDGYVDAVVQIPSSPAAQKKLVVKKGATALSFVDDAQLQPNAVDSSDTDWNTQDKVAAASPKTARGLLVGEYDSSKKETNASKIARIGTSTRAAREDHTHPFEHATGANQNLKPFNAAGKGTDTNASWSGSYARDTQSWTRDTTGTLDSSGTQTSTAFNGVRMLVVSRIERTTANTDRFYLRWADFDKNGCLYALSAELTNVYEELNHTYAE